MSRSALGARLVAWYSRIMLVVACLWFASLYCTNHPPYINLAQYARGTERMPFQGRDLMRWPMLAASHSATLQRFTLHRAFLHSPEALVMEVVAAVSVLLAGLAAVRIYRLAAPHAALPALPFALLILLCVFDFILGVPFTFPYDLPSTAFIGWGSYFALQRRFWPLLPIFLLGTWNRETSLFLIGVLAISLSTTEEGHLDPRALRGRDYAQIVALACSWIAILFAHRHMYRNSPTEAGPRIASNLHHLANPLLWPNILSASAFLLPWVFLLRKQITYAPLRNSLLLLPLWVVLLLCVGQILELRIYGDISVPVAAAAALILLSAAHQDVATSPIRT